ncbi:NADP-dependent oxidoreductase [Alphaproteobacteria bacterium]|nr:NADP-dependent oxidoreductase [Alphaproteobacteria bacterium]
MSQNKQIIVREIPKGQLGKEHFETQTVAMPTPGDGELLIKTILMSIDAANRAWMQGATYREAVKPGDVMHTYSIGQVIESKSDSHTVGDIVAVEAGWSEHVVVKAKRAQKMPKMASLSHLISVFGIAGRTAYHGLVDVGRPLAGETVLISAAAGSVGGYVGQIAKSLGCRAVGIAGGPEKCAWVKEELGFDDCIDYRAPGLFKAIHAACPDGVDVYFDNVGGEILETVLFQMNDNGRVACCGAISQYDGSAPSGPRNLPGMVVVKRLRMEGFIVTDFAKEAHRATKELQQLVQAGKLKIQEDIFEGLERAPDALIGLLAGDNRGKRMVRVAPDPA